MLVISRKPLKAEATEEDRKYSSIRIGDDITITVLEIRGEKVRLGISGPSSVVIDRAEVRDRRIAEQESWGRVFQSIGMDEEAESLATTVPQL
jgi:carbon storage regulator